MDFIDQYLDGLCRTCLIEVEESSYGNNTRMQWQSILDRIEECDTLRIAELLSTAVPQIQIKPSDELAKKICHDCLQQLLSTYRFQQMCVQSDKQMRELISTKHTDFKISILEAFKEHELEANGTDSKTETAHASSTHQILEHFSIEKPLHQISIQITDNEAVVSNSLEKNNKKLESCNNMKGRFNEFIKNEPVTDEDDTLSIECKEEEEMNVSKDEEIDTEAAQSSAANQLESIDQLPQYCNDSQSELTEFIKNVPIEDDESNIVFSDDETIHTKISMMKDEGLPIEFEERQVISPQHYHEKKDNSEMCVKRYNTRSNSTRHLRIKHSIKEITTTAILKNHVFALCDKSFKTAIPLKRHSRTHTGDRPECEKTSSTSRKESRKRWTREETLLLIQCYSARKDEFKHSRKKKYGYANVLEDMVSQGFSDNTVTTRTIEAKMRTLLLAYKSAKDHNRQTGATYCAAPFMEEMDEIFGREPIISNTHTLNIGASVQISSLESCARAAVESSSQSNSVLSSSGNLSSNTESTLNAGPISSSLSSSSQSNSVLSSGGNLSSNTEFTLNAGPISSSLSSSSQSNSVLSSGGILSSNTEFTLNAGPISSSLSSSSQSNSVLSSGGNLSSNTEFTLNAGPTSSSSSFSESANGALTSNASTSKGRKRKSAKECYYEKKLEIKKKFYDGIKQIIYEKLNPERN